MREAIKETVQELRTSKIKIKKARREIFTSILAGLLGLAAHVWLFFYDWKIALALLVIIWMNNLAISNQK